MNNSVKNDARYVVTNREIQQLLGEPLNTVVCYKFVDEDYACSILFPKRLFPCGRATRPISTNYLDKGFLNTARIALEQELQSSGFRVVALATKQVVKSDYPGLYQYSTKRRNSVLDGDYNLATVITRAPNGNLAMHPNGWLAMPSHGDSVDATIGALNRLALHMSFYPEFLFALSYPYMTPIPRDMAWDCLVQNFNSRRAR